MNTKLTKRDIQIAKAEILTYKLKYDIDFFNLSDKELIQIYNGAGSNQTNVVVRMFLTSILDIFMPAILLHDVDFTLQTQSFKKVNADFRYNMEQLLRAKSSNVFALSWNRFLKIAAFDMVNQFGGNWDNGKASQKIN